MSPGEGEFTGAELTVTCVCPTAWFFNCHCRELESGFNNANGSGKS